MGNRSSSAAQQQPQAPPALLSCAVTGDFEAFSTHWNGDNDFTSSTVKDHQDNNVLHALFSCRPSMGKSKECAQILDLIHDSLLAVKDTAADGKLQQLVDLYKARNTLGCTAIWILIAYGNVDMLKHVKAEIDNLSNSNNEDKNPLNLGEMVQIPNHQGDSPLLATCSQGNLAMVQYLHESLLSLEQFATLMAKPNLKGTTVLEIVVANGHEELLQYLLSTAQQEKEKEGVCPWLSEEQLFATNPTTGLSLFHICAERNFQAGLRLLLSFVTKPDGNNDKVVDETILATLKDKNQANPLHVACFCGNLEIVQVWVETLQQAYPGDENKIKIAQALDRPDGQGRTAYWIAGVKGHDAICQLLAKEGGVQTTQPAQMVQEIKEAAERRQATAAARLAKRPVDGNALLGG